MNRYGLTDFERSVIKPLLPNKPCHNVLQRALLYKYAGASCTRKSSPDYSWRV